MDAAPDLSGVSRLAPAGKSTARSIIGRSWVSTNNTRAPLAVCQCCIGKVAWAPPPASAQMSGNAPLSSRRLALVTSGPFGNGSRRLAPGKRLRIKNRYRQVVVHEIFTGHFAHLLGG